MPTPTPISAWAQEHAAEIPLVKPEDINADEPREMLRSLEADAWVIIAFGQKLSEPRIEDRFAINLHASLLPRWRGAAPIHRAIEAGDPETGNSVITLAQRMDAGAVLGTSRRPIEPHQTTGEMHDLLASDGPALIESVLQQRTKGLEVYKMQDEALVTRARKLSKEEGTLDFQMPASTCRAKIHAFNPWPAVTVTLGDHRLKLLRVRERELETTDAAPGTLLDVQSGIVACAGDAALELLEVQPAGKPAMAWEAFANGNDITPEARFTPVGGS